MIEKEIYIIRHGQTSHNLQGIVQGKGINLPLNETGKKQAAAFFEAYKSVPFQHLYSSTLLRAQQTILAFEKLGIPHKNFAALDEISWGNMEGNTMVMETSEEFKTLLDAWKAGDLDKKPLGGESPNELQARQKTFIEYLKKQPEKIILISMHGRAMRSLLCTLTNTSLTEMENFHHANLCLYKVNLNTDGNFEIILRNDQRHLDSLK